MKYILLLGGVIFYMQFDAFSQEKYSTAKQILDSSFATAKIVNKHVIIIFTASWCTNCHVLENSVFNDTILSELFDKNYIIKYMHVFESKNMKENETPGAIEILKRYSNGDPGLPFYLIFNKDGNLIADSYNRKDSNFKKLTYLDNIGRPIKKEEIDYFLYILKRTSTLSVNELKLIANKCNPELFKLQN
jgi:thioredoxin-related protein